MEDKIVKVSRDVERKAVKFVAGLVVSLAVFCVWLAHALTKEAD